jgi:glucan biosynthesis protein C
MVLVMPLVRILLVRRITNPEWFRYLTPIAPGHLWFLEYLFLFCLTAYLLISIFPASTQERILATVDGKFQALIRSRWKSALLAIPTGAVLSFSPSWVEIDSPLPGLALTPTPRVFCYYGIFFLFGWLLFRNRQSLPLLEKRVIGPILLALAAYFLGLLLFLAWFVGGLPDFQRGLLKGSGVWLFGLVTWLWIFALMSFFLKHASHPRPWLRYLADASYWIYLWHLPLVLWLQLQLSTLDLNAWLKFGSVYLATMFLLLIAYHFLVRRTFIGVFLNGSRRD